MKTLNLFKFILLGFLISACSDNNEPTGSGDGTGNEVVTSITLSTASNVVNTSSQVAFVVTGNSSFDLTSLSTLKIDGVSVSNPFSFNLEGTYQVVATYEDLTSNTLTMTVTDVPPTSIELSFDQDSYDNGDSATFVVKDNFNNTVTTEAEVTVNGTVVTANPYQFTADNTYNFVATYEGLTSNTVTINIVSGSGAPSTFTKKALLEDFTGTWCPQCPPAGAAITNAKSGNSNIFGVGYHAGGGGSEPMTISETAFWSGYYNVTGFPTVYVNGPDTRWNYNSIGQVNAELAETATVGLALEAAIVAGKLNLEVKVGFNATPDEEVQLMVYLVEDNVQLLLHKRVLLRVLTTYTEMF